MPLLGGLFNKRNTPQKHQLSSPNGPSTATESVASSTSNRDSTEGDFVVPDRSLPPPPLYNLPASASSSRLRLPFRRKPNPHRSAPNDSHSAVSLNDPPSAYISSVTSDPGHGPIAPPPRKSSIFGVYSESLPSVHSLPNDSSSRVHSDTPTRLSSADVRTDPSLYTPQSSKKPPGLFAWARERTKSKPSPPLSTAPITSPGLSVEDQSSFNLKSFRHIRADSTSPEKPPPSPSDPLLLPPRPRPRGDSVASDSSQRISVAAFREAQARSRANSPVPSFRPPSTADTLRVDLTGRKRASTVSVVSPIDSPHPNKNPAAAPLPGLRPDSSAVDTSSDDSESEEDDEDVDSDGHPLPKPAQDRTITRRVIGTRARSDTGHGYASTSNGQVSNSRQGPPEQSKVPLMSQSDQAPAPANRPRSSISTSSMTPSGAALRASNLVPANMPLSSFTYSKQSLSNPNDESEESTDSEDTDSEDMPLRDLVAPRRPGSAASNYSNRPRIPPKPLIDINSLAGGPPPLLTPILRHENSLRNMNPKHKEQDDEKDQPFSIPAALAFSSSSSPISPPPSKQDPLPVNGPVSTAHDRRSTSDLPSPLKPKTPDNDDDIINAIRLVGVLDEESEQPPGALKLPVKAAPDRIVPTPIREREPPTSFTVLSRPPQRQSTAETSMSLSPVSSQTQFNSAARTTSQSDIDTRQLAPTMTSPSAQSDKSDVLSVSSAAHSSTSRTSSRIPPVPLIHSIPDSPSVKEEYKAGRPRTASHGSAVSPGVGRSSQAPTTLAPALSAATPSKTLSLGVQRQSFVPQPPFVSKASVRGESPAGSSTGDSSSGRSPFTPRDGSDIGTRTKDDASDLGSTVKARGHAKKLSVTFEDLQPGRGRERAKIEVTDEQRTRERRRSEAKAAIELGKIVNGRGPLVHDDSDEDMTLRGRNPTINVTMDNSVHGVMPPNWGAWQQPMGTGMNPMVPPQFNNDPAFLAAHQRALLIAKQAYQMAVAQHAMQMAGEEWERSSNIGGFSSSGSVYGGGSGGSVYGGGSGGSVYGGGAGMAPIGMMGMSNMGMLMPPNAWGRSSVAFPTSGASGFGGIGSSQSEYGGGGGGWGTRSVYGEPPFRPSSSHGNFTGSGVPSSAASAYGGSSRPRASTGAAPPSGLSAQTRSPGKSAARTRAAPPSSWKSGR